MAAPQQRATRWGLRILIATLIAASGMACGTDTAWEGQLTFEIDYVYNTKADVSYLYKDSKKPPSSAPTFSEIPRDVLPDRIHEGDIVECHVTIRERSTVGGDAPSLVDDCSKVG